MVATAEKTITANTKTAKTITEKVKTAKAKIAKKRPGDFIRVLLAIFLSAMMLVQSMPLAATAASAGTPSYRGSLKDVKFIRGTYQDEISIEVDDYSGYMLTKLDSPDRFVIDIPETRTSLQEKTVTVSGGLNVKGIRYAQFEGTKARIVIDLKGNAACNVVEKEGKLSIFITKPVYKGIAAFIDNSVPYISLPGIRLLDEDGKPLFKEKYDDNRYIIELPYTDALEENGKAAAYNPFLTAVEVNSDKARDTARITFTLRSGFVFQAVNVKGIDGGVFKLSRGERPRNDEPGEEVDNPGQDSGDEKPLRDIEINHKMTDFGELVEIPFEDYTGFNVMRVTSPDRIVIDIPNSKSPVNVRTLTIGSWLIKSIRYAQFDKATTRVVIDTMGQLDYDVTQNPGKLIVNVKQPSYKNITYSNAGDRVGLLIKGAKLTEGAKTLTKFYEESWDAANKLYTITFPSKNADIGSGIIKINDSYLNYIEIVNNKSSGKTSLIFSAKDEFVYRTITRYVAKGSTTVPDDTAITILKPASAKDRLVVIDPGHGGNEPGAVGNGLVEKDLNLDIARRLNALLKEHGVKTYMTRDDDSFVGLYERCYIANDMNAALFLSIHNNAAHSQFHGTETIYYMDRVNDTGFSGKKFAQLIQDEVVGALNTYYRRVFANPQLVVLRETKAPAALAEIAFITNSGDAARLKTEAFRQKAAEALCKAVLKALDMLDQ